MSPTPRKDVRFITTVALAVITLWILYAARWGILFVYVAVLIATGVAPLVRWLEQRPLPASKRRPPRWMAALLVYVLGLGFVIGAASALVPPLVAQAQELIQNLPSFYDQLQGYMGRHGVTAPDRPLDELIKEQAPSAGSAVGKVLITFGSFLGVLFGALLVIVLSYYLVLESRSLLRWILPLVPTDRRAEVRMALADMADKIGAWMVGQLILSAIIGTISAVVLGILGIPYFYVLAMIAAIGELIPYAGPVVAAVPAVLLAMTMSWQTGLTVLIFYFALQQLENHLLVPKLMQHQVGLSPAIVIVAITIGSMALGVLGALLAVPTAAIVQVALATVLAED